MRERAKSWLIFCVLCVAAPAALADRDEARSAIVEAQTLIDAAVRVGAQELAVRDLDNARDNLAAAQAEADERDWRDARGAAIRAQRDAEVAAARARALKAEEALADLRKAIDTLRYELERTGESS